MIYMLNFENIEDLVSHMFANLGNENNLVSVIANKQMITDIMVELLNYKNVILNSCDIDYEEEYDREYIVSLFDDAESDNWHVNVEKCYLPEKQKYVATEGYVLFHEDVNSKALIDMQNNECMPLGEHDWFAIGNEELEGINEDDNDVETNLNETDPEDELDDSGYSITVKVGLDTDEAEKIIRDMRRNFQRELSDMLGIPYRPLPLRFFW
ncbi:hypothetical protein D7V90_07495 [bacterium 1xD42-87]|nr:hypothetical protein D7V90_07495 [bacterium 1xD42-87]